MSYGPRPWRQTNWDWRAATNFALGGTGAGLMLAVSVSQIDPLYPVSLALAFVGLGLGAVWLEIGRKLRAVNVFFNPFTSWMTRESFAAVLLFASGGAALLLSSKAAVIAAAFAALAFLWCQARILHGAKGIPAWRAPQIVPLIVSTGFAEGSGLCLLFTTADMALILFVLAVVARAIAWSRYRRAVKSAALAPAGRGLLYVGSTAALLLAAAGYFVPELRFLAGVAAVAAGWWLKFALVTRASFNQGFSLPRLPVRGTR